MKKSKFSPFFVAKSTVAAVPIFVLLFILNQNFAFFGNHKVSITSFTDLPSSVQYIGAGEIGLVSTPEGLRTRPYKDRVDLAVTLPRGFETMTMRAEFSADPYATVALSAKVPVNAKSMSSSFRLPIAYGLEWRRLELGDGALYIKNHPEIQSLDTFWESLEKQKKVYSIRDGFLGYIPPTTYNAHAQIRSVRVPGGFRGNFTVSMYFDGRPQQITFDSKIAYASSGKKNLQVELEYRGVVLVTKSIPEVVGLTQKNVLEVPKGDPGFYTLRFIQYSEATVVSNLRFQGDAVELSKYLFFDQSSTPVRLYSNCTDLSVQAVHALGLQSPIWVNGQEVKLTEVKKPQKVSLRSDMNTLQLPHADVILSNTCGFMLQPNSDLRKAYANVYQRITVVPQISAATVEAADFLFDPLSSASIENEKEGSYSVEKTFDLHSLSAVGKKFTFSLEVQGLLSRPEAFIHLKNVTFIAHRPSFIFADISKAFQALF